MEVSERVSFSLKERNLKFRHGQYEKSGNFVFMLPLRLVEFKRKSFSFPEENKNVYWIDFVVVFSKSSKDEGSLEKIETTYRTRM